MTITKEQKDFLGKVVKGSWSINPYTNLIDVDGDVSVPTNHIKDGKLPVSFGRVSVMFNVSKNGLFTLEGCPYWVGSNFVCSWNNLTSLKHAPSYVGGNLTCTFNKLTSYKYAPNYVGVDAYIWSNPYIESFDWIPDYVGGQLNLDLTNIESEFLCNIIPEIEALLAKGISIFEPENHYYPFREAYYERKIAELI